MEVKLVTANGEQAGKETRLQGSKFFIGRAEDCYFRPQDDSVSRHHCVVLVENGFVAVRDMGSKAGTFVNGERVRGEHELKDGDRIRVGELEFDVQVDASDGGEDSELPDRQEASPAIVDSATEDNLDLATVEDDLDLDSWLSDSPVSEGADASERPEPESPDQEQRKKKEKPVDVVGVWKKGHWKPTSVNPSQAAADAVKDFFKRR